MYTHQFSGDAGNLESQKFCPKLGDHIVASIFESSKATRPPTQAISEYPLTELQFCGVETFSDDRAQIPSELKDYIANSKGIKEDSLLTRSCWPVS